MKDIVIIGAGGCAKETLWIIESINERCPTWNFLGFVNNENKESVIGDDEWLKKYPKEIYVVCAIAKPFIRKKVVEQISINVNIKFATIIHPDILCSSKSIIGKGTIIAAKSIVSVDASIGEHVLINFGCFIGHDSELNNFSTVYTDAKISGGVKIGEMVEIGAGSVILEKIQIGDKTSIGLGSVVLRDIPSDCTAMGYPAKPLLSNKKGCYDSNL